MTTQQTASGSGRWAWLALLSVLCAAPASVQGAAGAAAATGESPRLALLIGVETYPKLRATEQLRGSRNDIAAMQQLLQERFGFRPEEMRVLSDASATAAAIRGALATLVKRVQARPPDTPPAQVVLHFSGHGSQIADQPEGDPDCDEESGLDQTLVPYDAEKQGGDKDIRDDELFHFTEALCAGGRARLWVVLDCCHSGGGVRGVTSFRRLDRGLTPLPAEAAQQRKIVHRKLPAGVVTLSACRASEQEPEYQFGDEHHGLLTHFLVSVLTQQSTISGLSYGLLREAILNRYRQDPTVSQAPLPQAEGDPASLRGVVLGATSQADRKPVWKVVPAGPEPGKVRVAAGAFHGVTVGSVYELYDAPEHVVWQAAPQAKEASPYALGWVRIEQVDGASAQAQAIQWAPAGTGEPVAVTLPPGFKQGFAVERYHQHGDFGVRLRVVQATGPQADGPPLGPQDPAVPGVIRETLAAIPAEGESPWLTWVAGPDACDLLLRIDGDYAALFPAIGMVQLAQALRTRGEAVPASLRGGWGPIELRTPQGAQQLADMLRRIVRARNLLRVAAAQAARGASPIGVELQLVSVKLRPDLTVESWQPWSASAEGTLTMKMGDNYAMRVINRQKLGKPVYVTVLAIDPDMEIQTVMPYQAGDGLVDEQRLDPGADRVSDAFESIEPPGQHHVIALATREPNDFFILPQPALPRVRGDTRSPNTSLEQLLMEQTYFRTRGGQRKRPVALFDDTWSATTLSFDLQR